MTSSLPVDIQRLVTDMLASGPYESEADVMREALALLRQRDIVRRDVREALAELERGEGIDAESVFRELRDKAAQYGTPDA